MKNILIIYVFLILLSGCITSLDLEHDNNRFLLVVDGKITQKEIPHELLLNYSKSYGSTSTNPVIGAKIKLVDGDGNFEEYIEEINGRYILYGNDLQRSPGKSYHVEIELSNNKKYSSTPQVMPEIMKPEKIYYETVMIEETTDLENISSKRYLNIYINTPVIKNNQNFYFNWRVDHTYSFAEISCHPLKPAVVCYIKRKFDNEDVKIFSSENLSGGMLEGFRVASVYLFPDWEFYEKHFYNVAQHSITKEAFTYWETVNKVAQSTGSIFDTPPAPVNGNIYNIENPDERVLGFFEVSAVDTIRTYTFADDLEPIAVSDRCSRLYYYKSIGDPACCDCLTIRDSQLERPLYWGYLHEE